MLRLSSVCRAALQPRQEISLGEDTAEALLQVHTQHTQAGNNPRALESFQARQEHCEAKGSD